MGKQCQTLFWGGSKITANGDCSHEIKRHLLLGRKAMTNLDSILKSRDITLPTTVYLVKAMVFPVVMYGCESWTIKKAKWSAVKSLSRVWLFATPWTVAYQAPPSMGFSRQQCWSGVPLPSPSFTSTFHLFLVLYSKFKSQRWLSKENNTRNQPVCWFTGS